MISNELPEITVAVCTYNRSKFIGACLECLAKQTLAKHLWEVIVVDNASTDATPDIVKSFINSAPPINIRYVFEGQKGLSYARNRSVAEARSGIICFIDDDAEAVPAFVETIHGFMASHPMASGAGGKVLPKYSESAEPAWMNKFLDGFVGRVDHGDEVKQFKGRMKYPIGCNMTYRKAILQEAGGFNNKLTFRGDDKHIFYAVTAINPAVYYLPAAQVFHNIDAHRLTHQNFKKLFLKTGNEERIRIITEKGKTGLAGKAVEYIFKFAASCLIYIAYSLKGQESKGRYVLYSQWYTLLGFLTKNVFVR